MIRAAILLVVVCGTTHAGDWPRFRGPDGDGTSAAKDVPVEWGPEKNVVWRTELAGEGWSSPVLLEGRVYLTAAVPPEEAEGNARSLRVLCLDAKSGKVVWNVEVFEQTAETAGRIHPKNSYASPTPVTDGVRLFVHFGNQGTACLELDGKVVWRNNELKYKHVHGSGPTPVLVGENLFVNCDGGNTQFVVAMSQKTGEIVWRKERRAVEGKPFSFATAAVLEVDGKTQIVSPAAGQVEAYDPADGSVLWYVRYDGYSVIPKPVVAHGLVFLATSYDRPSFLAIDPTGSGDVTDTHLKWSFQRGAPHTPSPVVVGDEVYVVSDRGIATCADAKTGEVHWQERIGGNFSASTIAVTTGTPRVYFTDEAGKTTVVKAAKTFELLAENDLGERTLASPAIDDGTIYLRTSAALYRIGKSP